MARLVTYKLRIGNSIPIIAGGGGNSSTGNVIFTFGTETQEIISCAAEDEVLGSADMCLLGGDYFSANYNALPAKVNGKFKFTSNITKPPIFSANYNTGGAACISSSSISGDF